MSWNIKVSGLGPKLLATATAMDDVEAEFEADDCQMDEADGEEDDRSSMISSVPGGGGKSPAAGGRAPVSRAGGSAPDSTAPTGKKPKKTKQNAVVVCARNGIQRMNSQ